MQVYIFYTLVLGLILIYVVYLYVSIVLKTFKSYIFPKIYKNHDNKFIELVISKFFLKDFEALSYTRLLLPIVAYILCLKLLRLDGFLGYLIPLVPILAINILSSIVCNIYKKNKIVGTWTFSLLSRFFQAKEKIGKYMLPLRKTSPVDQKKIMYNVALKLLRELITQKAIHKHTYTMINSLMRMELHTIRNIMIPRTNIISIGRDKTLNQAINLANRSGFSRIPVTGKNLDDIVGIFYLKDIVHNLTQSEDKINLQDRRVDSLMRTPLFIAYSQNIISLLESMQKQHIHMGVILDEYGGTEGIITIEDILEEIVGEIEDEYDRVPNVEPVLEVKPDRVRVMSTLSLVRLSELFPDINLKLDMLHDVDTVWALMALNLKMVPIRGSSIVYDGLRFTVEESHGRRNQVLTVLVERI